MNDIDLAALVGDPEQIPPEAIPTVVGELERLKTSLVGSLVRKLTMIGSVSAPFRAR